MLNSRKEKRNRFSKLTLRHHAPSLQHESMVNPSRAKWIHGVTGGSGSTVDPWRAQGWSMLTRGQECNFSNADSFQFIHYLIFVSFLSCFASHNSMCCFCPIKAPYPYENTVTLCNLCRILIGGQVVPTPYFGANSPNAQKHSVHRWRYFPPRLQHMLGQILATIRCS